MKRVILISSLLLTISFTVVAQIVGATQGGEQKAFGATAPSATFQSTSSMSSSGSTYSANPELNADGTAAYQGETYSPAKTIRRAGGVRKNSFGDNQDNPGDPSPLGDAMLPLTLLACAYMCLRAFLKRKRATEN